MRPEDEKYLVSESDFELLRIHFDREFYLLSNPDVRADGIDPLDHYLEFGWKEGRDPSPTFSTKQYIALRRRKIPEGTNPFLHFLHAQSGDKPEERAEAVEDAFDADFYLRANPALLSSGRDPFEHYMTQGWVEGRDPTEHFSTIFYARAYPDVMESGLHPFEHYVRIGCLEGRLSKSPRPYIQGASGIDEYSESEIAARHQDTTFPLELEVARKVLAIVVPEHNEMSGGIYSMFSIAKHIRQSKRHHGYEVMLVTNPNKDGLTYCRQRNFSSAEPVWRFEQLRYCVGAEEIYLHLPEYAALGFIERCSAEMLYFLVNKEKLYINILNQNIMLMPDAAAFCPLRRLADEVGQSVAHHAYFGQEYADKYNLPTLLLPAYTDLSAYPASPADAKEPLIIYSLDYSKYKQDCIRLLREKLPEYKLVEIRNITFDHFMDLATRCRFSISFGEGFDGYVAQPIYQGGIGMTVYNDEFFPSPSFKKFPNFFATSDAMMKNIVPLIRSLEQNKKEYENLNRQIIDKYDELYSYDDYVKRIGKLVAREWEVRPQPQG